MRFSILVPVYNVQNYLLECLDHLRKQSFKNFEAILIDDGSTDGSGRIADRYAQQDSRFRVIHKENQGLLAARRDAIRLAKGDYLVFCDSDDFLEWNALECIDRILKQEPTTDILMYDAFLFRDPQNQKGEFDGNILERNTKKNERENVGRTIKINERRTAGKKVEVSDQENCMENRKRFIGEEVQLGDYSDKKTLYRLLFQTMKLQPVCFKAVRREIADAEGDYSAFYGLGFGEDMLQTAVFFRNAKNIRYCGLPLYNYRQSSGMMGRFHENYYAENRRIHQSVRELLKDEPVPQMDDYMGAFMMYIAYGAFHQCAFLKRPDIQSVNAVMDDPYFRTMYEAVQKSSVWNEISSHERLAVWLIYHRQKYILAVLCKLIHVVKGYGTNHGKGSGK